MSKLEEEKALSKAKIALLRKTQAVFISTIVVSLKSSWNDEWISPSGIRKPNPTACTDGVNLVLNKDWYMKLNPLEQIGLLAHEAWHVALQHVLPARVGNRDFNVYNQAADHVINLMLTDEGYRIPAGGLCDSAYRGMSTEQIYDILIKDPSKQDPNFVPDFSNVTQPDPLSQLAHNNQVADTLVRAATQAQLSGNAGNIPGDILIELNKLLYPKLPWHVILHDHLNGLSNDDYSYSKANRRFMPEFFLPSLYSEGMGTFACAIDTSGSTSDHDLMVFGTEIDSAIETMNPDKIFIIDFDTQINTVHELKEGDSVTRLQFKGRGGTDLTPVFEHFKLKPPQVLIIFSDLECDPITTNPGYPVIWIRTPGNGHTPSFGKIIQFDPKR